MAWLEVAEFPTRQQIEWLAQHALGETTWFVAWGRDAKPVSEMLRGYLAKMKASLSRPATLAREVLREGVLMAAQELTGVDPGPEGDADGVLLTTLTVLTPTRLALVDVKMRGPEPFRRQTFVGVTQVRAWTPEQLESADVRMERRPTGYQLAIGRSPSLELLDYPETTIFPDNEAIIEAIAKRVWPGG